MPTAGRELYDRGWRQGSRIAVRVQQSAYGSFDPVQLVEQELPSGMDLVLATQDCDLVKDEEKLPQLEGIGCFDDPELASRVRANDARYFVLDPEPGIVADRAHGAYFTREALAALPNPQAGPCGDDRTRQRRFARWLGARYDRPAVPDAAVEAIQRPLAAAVHRLCRPGRPHEQLNRDLHEIRIAGDLGAGPPFRISMIFVLREGVDAGSADLLVAELIEAAGFAIEAVSDGEGAAVLIREWVAAPPSLLTVAAYHGSVGIPLAHESYRGSETLGAEPLDAESA
jgi:hypothetical protein